MFSTFVPCMTVHCQANALAYLWLHFTQFNMTISQRNQSVVAAVNT